mmetsp:Transcript_22489/g.67400  ORF Transcript_22489/g.67400 Transcript_22489/m.67400 type:complete len:232 (-) Transcript_22489:762-1457(-)
MTRLVHVRPQLDLELRGQAPPSHELAELVDAAIELRGVRVEGRQDGDDLTHDERPRVPHDEHADDRDEVLHPVLGRDVAVPDACQRHGRPIVRQHEDAHRVLRRRRVARVALGVQQRGQPRGVLGVVRQGAVHDPALEHDPHAGHPMARDGGDDDELPHLDHEQRETHLGLQLVVDRRQPLQPRQEEQPNDAQHQERVGERVGPEPPRGEPDPARRHREQVQPEPTSSTSV